MWYYYVRDSKQEDSIERILKRELGLSRKQISRLKFQENGLSVDGCQRRSTDWLRRGETLAVSLMDRQGGTLEELKEEPRVLYEDESLVVVEKRSGQVCHPSGMHYRDSLANQLVWHFQNRQENTSVRIIGRLDKDTSGIVVAAKHKIAAQKLSWQRDRGIFGKEYLALVHGEFSDFDGFLREPIARVQGHPLKMKVCAQGKPAKTQYHVIAQNRRYALVSCRLYTGRTHQIRVHMQSIGHPLVNDVIYGLGEQDDFAKTLENEQKIAGDRHKKLGLHAAKVWMRHPLSGEELILESACDFLAWIEVL